MDYERFHALSAADAQTYLRMFRECESTAIEAMKPDAEKAGLKLDYAFSRLGAVLKWMLKDVKVTRVSVPSTEPEWIRAAHQDGLIEFDHESRALILRAAYYLGESFVRASEALSWGLGDPEFIHQNMPVVKGFRFGKEMPPIVIIENVSSRIFGDSAPLTELDDAAKVWASDNMPKSID